MIDLGMHKGQHIFYTGNRSLAQLIIDGEVMAVPTPNGMVFKRVETCTEVEKRAAYTIDEVRAWAEKYGSEK